MPGGREPRNGCLRLSTSRPVAACGWERCWAWRWTTSTSSRVSSRSGGSSRCTRVARLTWIVRRLRQAPVRSSCLTWWLPHYAAISSATTHRLTWTTRPIRVGQPADPLCWCSGGAGGDPVNASTFSRTWTPARTKIGLPPRWGFHGLRHYYATLLIHAGASVKTVQLALGHSTSTITLNEYVHEWLDALDRTRSLVDGALGTREAAATSAGSRS